MIFVFFKSLPFSKAHLVCVHCENGNKTFTTTSSVGEREPIEKQYRHLLRNGACRNHLSCGGKITSLYKEEQLAFFSSLPEGVVWLNGEEWIALAENLVPYKEQLKEVHIPLPRVSEYRPASFGEKPTNTRNKQLSPANYVAGSRK